MNPYFSARRYGVEVNRSPGGEKMEVYEKRKKRGKEGGEKEGEEEGKKARNSMIEGEIVH